MIPARSAPPPRPERFPRVSGDEPLVLKPARELLSFSRRERG